MLTNEQVIEKLLNLAKQIIKSKGDMKLNDGNDANDGNCRSETYASLVRENKSRDSNHSVSDLPSQPSHPSQIEFTKVADDEELAF